MKFRLGMKSIVAGPGDTVEVHAGATHKFTNCGDGVARAAGVMGRRRERGLVPTGARWA